LKNYCITWMQGYCPACGFTVMMTDLYCSMNCCVLCTGFG